MRIINQLALFFFMLFVGCDGSANHKELGNMNREMNHLKKAIEVAHSAKQKGNLPYGCILVDSNGQQLLAGENTINTDNDCLAHAEINLIREACKSYSYEFLNTCTIYTSDEPCAMCSSAIYWSGIGKLVFGLSKVKFYDTMGRDNPNWVFELGSKDVLESGGRKVEVFGPFLEDEVLELHKTD